MTCRNCVWMLVPRNANGDRRPRKDKMYLCEAPIPEAVLPFSITKSYGWKWPPSRGWVSTDDHEGCPLFEKIK